MKRTMQLVNTHRKCMKCKTTTLDLSKAQCDCGGFMYPIGDIYQPVVVQKKDVKKQVQAS